jgi:hypothetical protein
MEPPQEGDKWFMQAMVRAGFTLAQEMKILNCFHCHQEVIYLLDVFNAGGRCLDRQYLDHWKQDEKWSTLILPPKHPQRAPATLEGMPLLPSLTWEAHSTSWGFQVQRIQNLGLVV